MKMRYSSGSGSSSKKVGGRSMSNVKSSDSKQVSAGKGTIRTPFNKAILRNISRS